MLNNNERIETLDKFGHKTGRIIQRGSELSPDEYMGVVTIVVVDDLGRFLVTKRHPNKTPGLMWEVTGGGILAYESPEEAAKRELSEETGITINKDDLISLRTLINDQFYCYQYMTFISSDSNIELEKDEVIDYKFLDYNSFFTFIKNNNFISYIGDRITEVKEEITDIYNKHMGIKNEKVYK